MLYHSFVRLVELGGCGFKPISANFALFLNKNLLRHLGICRCPSGLRILVFLLACGVLWLLAAFIGPLAVFIREISAMAKFLNGV